MSAEPPDSPLEGSFLEAVPPAENAAPSHTLQAGRYYGVNSSRASYTELWRDTRSPLVLFAWLTKILRIKVPGTINDPNVVALQSFLVDGDAIEQTVPSDTQEKFQPILRELTDLGFNGAVYFMMDDLFHHSRMCQVALLHRDGRSIARVTHRCEGIKLVKTHFFTEFLSPLTRDTFFCSSTALSQSLVPAACQLNWHPKATTSQLWVSHRQELDTAGQSGHAIVMRGHDDMVDVLEAHHEVVRDFHLARGVFSSMRGEELEQAVLLEENVEEARCGRMQHPEVMAQLERLQNKRTNWSSAIIVLMVSIGLFMGVGVGLWQWSWDMLLMIVGILLVHEAGHYVAMKMFDYRNVRMFFIPFIGAAVSGQNYSAPGWKKVVVSLMGPLPGIFLGGVLGIAGLIKGNDTMVQVGTMTVLLNAFQLLPVLPLDGGRVMQGLLFSRNHYLDMIFQVLAAGSLAGVGALVGDTVLLVLGLFMLSTVPLSFRVARIATELRRMGFAPGTSGPARANPPRGRLAGAPPALPAGAISAVTALPQAMPVSQAIPFATPPSTPPPVEEDGIPQPVAEAIIERIKTRFPRLSSGPARLAGAKQIAQITLMVYETLATRSPGIAASIGFVFLHGASFVVALVLLVVLTIPQDPDFMSIVAAAGINPKYSIEPDTIATWQGASASADDPQHPSDADVPAIDAREAPARRAGPGWPAYETICATFSTSDQAREAFDEVIREAPPSASLAYFGHSVLLSMPSRDESAIAKWFDRFDEQADDVFIQGGGSYGGLLTLTFQTSASPSVTELEEQLSTFFEIPAAICLIPPWAGDHSDQRSPIKRARHRKARRMLGKLLRTTVPDSPELEDMRERIARSARRNDQAKQDRLYEQLSDLLNELLMSEYKRIRNEEADPIARTLADRYIAIKVEQSKAENEAETLEDVEDDHDWDEFMYQSFALERSKLGPMMGQLPLPSDDGRPTPWDLRHSPKGGYAQLAGGNNVVIRVTFENVSHGAPALVKWLKQRGCSDFKYEISSGGIYDYD